MPPGAVSERLLGFTSFNLAQRIPLVLSVKISRITNTPANLPRTIWLMLKSFMETLRVSASAELLWLGDNHIAMNLESQ